MLRRGFTTWVSLVLIGSFLAFGGSPLAVHAAASAAAAPGSGPDSALPVPAGPTTVAVGQRIWYGFQYAGNGSQILVDMSAAPGGSAGFTVWTPGNAQTMLAGKGEDPVGRGAPQMRTSRKSDGTTEEVTLYNGDLIWAGGFRFSGTYYVAVQQTGAAPATVNLTVTGSGVSAIPAPVGAVLAAAPTTPTTASGAAQATSVAAAASCAPAAPALQADTPAQALSLPATGSYLLSAGQRAWFAFHYKGDGSQILVDLRATPGGSAGFAVYTPGDTGTPVGRGSQQIITRILIDGTLDETTLYGGDLIWSGSFRIGGNYYVAVDQIGPGPSTIMIGISGSGVSGGQAAAALPGNTQPAAACAPQPTASPTAATLQAGGPGSAPGQPLPLPSISSYLLPVGQRAWFAFQYKGDGSQILLDLRATPDSSAGFAVYTPGDTGTPVGRGSQIILKHRMIDGSIDETTLYGGDLIWSGSFRSPGTYYVAVDQTGANPSTITLKINGSGVSAPASR